MLYPNAHHPHPLPPFLASRRVFLASFSDSPWACSCCCSYCIPLHAWCHLVLRVRLFSGIAGAPSLPRLHTLTLTATSAYPTPPYPISPYPTRPIPLPTVRLYRKLSPSSRTLALLRSPTLTLPRIAPPPSPTALHILLSLSPPPPSTRSAYIHARRNLKYNTAPVPPFACFCVSASPARRLYRYNATWVVL